MREDLYEYCFSCNKPLGAKHYEHNGRAYCASCTVKCSTCSIRKPKNIICDLNGENVCEDCLAEKGHTCKHCGAVFVGETDLSNVCQDCFDSLYVSCEFCSEYILKTEATEKFGVMLCKHCIDNVTKCDSCGDLVESDDVIFVQGEYWCHDCVSDYAVRCMCCNTYVNAEDATNGICSHCIDEYYNYCTECDVLIHDDNTYYDNDDNPFCERCWSRGAIHGYSYKPEPQFYGEGDCHFGIELEIDEGGYNSDNATTLLSIANENSEHIYIKSDGSLNDGMELVSHPMSYSYHLNWMPWKAVMRKALALGYRSHTSGTCGLHIHIGRTVFGEDRDEQDLKIKHIVRFIDDNWYQILNFSRRTPGQADRWAARYFDDKQDDETALATYYDAVKGNYGRYKAVNLTNWSTIEIRIFRGTLKYSTFVATLQFTQELVKQAAKSTLPKDWCDFIKAIPLEDYPELDNYLSERHLKEEV